jgi:hypothetical protein
LLHFRIAYVRLRIQVEYSLATIIAHPMLFATLAAFGIYNQSDVSSRLSVQQSHI